MAKPSIRPVYRAMAMVAVVLTVGCSSSSGPGPDPPPSASFENSIVAIPPHYDTRPASWGQFVDEASSVAVDLISIGYLSWAETESNPGSFDWSDFAPLVADPRVAALSFVFDVGTPIAFSGGLDLPPDLSFSTFADSTLRARYFDYLASALDDVAPGRISRMTLHAEGVREFLDSHPDQEGPFCDLVADAVRFLHDRQPRVRVGVYWRYENSDPSLIACLNRETDYVALAAILNPPADAPEDVVTIVQGYLELFPDKPLALVEVGFPAATRLGSSEAIQAGFVDTLYAFLASVDPTRFEFVAWYEIFDEDRTLLEPIADALYPGDPQAKEDFLAWNTTLGLQTLDGRRKPGWAKWVSAVKGR